MKQRKYTHEEQKIKKFQKSNTKYKKELNADFGTKIELLN